MQHSQQGKPRQAGLNPLITLSVNGFLTFLLTTMLFTFFYHHFNEWVWILCGLGFAVGTAFVVVNPADQMKRALGALICFGIIFGIVAGEYNYRAHTGPYFSYDESREYKNVLPSEPAAAHADAGKIEFAGVAQLDTTKSVGFKRGHMYCVAPIMDATASTRVEFWAVGMDCCEPRNDFRCDDAGDAAVKGGVVVMDTSVLLPTHLEFYHMAVKEAEAAFDLQSASEPLYIRWMKDPETWQSELWTAGIAQWLLFSALYGVWNAGLSFVAVSMLRG